MQAPTDLLRFNASILTAHSSLRSAALLSLPLSSQRASVRARACVCVCVRACVCVCVCLLLVKGGTLVHALQMIVDRGARPENIRVICALAAPPGLSKISDKFPGLRVYCGIIDPELNDLGFILPGVGDAGDRSFGT